MSEAEAEEWAANQMWLLRFSGLGDLEEPSITADALRAYVRACRAPGELPDRYPTRVWWAVYVLADPRSYDIRYVGTTCGANTRMAGHLSLRERIPAKNEWIAALRDEGLLPLMRQVDLVHCDYPELDAREYAWIRACLRLGMPLTNKVGVTVPHPGQPRPAKGVHVMGQEGES